MEAKAKEGTVEQTKIDMMRHLGNARPGRTYTIDIAQPLINILHSIALLRFRSFRQVNITHATMELETRESIPINNQITSTCMMWPN